VERTGEAVVITKNGKPVAELVPSRITAESIGSPQGPPLHYRGYHFPDRRGVGSAQVILLDTHVAIWILRNDAALGKKLGRWL
jgi:hypothetical protein